MSLILSISIIIFCLNASCVIFVKKPGLFLIFSFLRLFKVWTNCKLFNKSAIFNWASISFSWKLSINNLTISSSSFALFNNSTINASWLSISLKLETRLYLITIPLFKSPTKTLNTLVTQPNKLFKLILLSIEIYEKYFKFIISTFLS